MIWNGAEQSGLARAIFVHLLGSVLFAGTGLLLISCDSARNWADKEFGTPQLEDDDMEGRQFGDIPAPDDAEFQKNMSYATTIPGGTRVARVVYKTQHSLSYLESFYNRRMKNFNWAPAENNLENRGTLHFYSDREIVRVKIQELNNGPSEIRILIDRRETAG